MKPIKVSKQKTPFSIKLSFSFVLLIGLISLVFSLKYSGEGKIEYPKLKPDPNLIPPQCSKSGGFYNEAISIALTSPSGDKIYYTLDGSEPSLSSFVYTKPLIIKSRTDESNVLSAIPTSTRWQRPLETVFKGIVLRSIAVNDNNKKSSELIRTFFVNEKGANRYSMAVIAITVDPDDFFGHKNGIYVMGEKYEDKDYYIKKNLPLNLPWWEYPSNYLKRGDNSERPIHIEFYENDGKPGFEFRAGVRINGNATRGFSQKSLRICFDKKYGSDQLNYPVFPGKKVEKFNSLILRNSGNDWDKTMFRDAFMQSLLEDTQLDLQAYRPSIVFINGEYWGIHNIRERSDEDYIANKYGMSLDSIIILEHSGNLFYGKKNDQNEFKELLKFVQANDMTLLSNYTFLEHRIDIVNFMDFIIANVYFCNADWPNNNVRFWRYRTNEILSDSTFARDGRWRWMLYDTDWGFGYTGSESYKMNLLEKASKTGSIGIIFSEILKNRSFRIKFKNRFLYHLNTTFESNHVTRKIDQFQNLLEPEISEHINRWRAIGSVEKWKANVQELKKFAIERPAVQKQQLNDFLNKIKN